MTIKKFSFKGYDSYFDDTISVRMEIEGDCSDCEEEGFQIINYSIIELTAFDYDHQEILLTDKEYKFLESLVKEDFNKDRVQGDYSL